MLCDACKKNPATVHSMTIINGVKEERYLCAACANAAQYKLPSLFDMLGGMVPTPQIATDSACACGRDLNGFHELGLLGCPQCYSTHRDSLIPVIKRVQGGKTRHVGRMPGRRDIVQEPVTAPQRSELEQLKDALQQAVKEEQYERAAELRDRIKALEHKGA